jgi:predicted small secreted protein
MTRSLIFLLAAATLITGCNAVRGVGRDVKSVGEVVEKSTS